jgi:hypothetical protein
VHVDRKGDIGHLRVAAAFGERDNRLAPLRLFRCFAARAGVEERELGDPLRRLTHDLESDIAAHRQTGEREARRSRRQYSARDRGHVVVAGVVGDHDGAEPP